MLSRFHLIPERYASNFKIGTQLGFETSLPKNVLDQIGGGLGQGSIQTKFGTPTYFCNH